MLENMYQFLSGLRVQNKTRLICCLAKINSHSFKFKTVKSQDIGNHSPGGWLGAWRNLCIRSYQHRTWLSTREMKGGGMVFLLMTGVFFPILHLKCNFLRLWSCKILKYSSQQQKARSPYFLVMPQKIREIINTKVM